MLVECAACYASYNVEPDAFSDGGMIYYVNALAEKLRQADT